MNASTLVAQKISVTTGLFILLSATSPKAHVQKTAITVQAGQPSKTIRPDLFGIFFEDLNYAADGGLYAENLRRGQFRCHGERRVWITVGTGKHSADSATGLPKNRLRLLIQNRQSVFLLQS